MVITKREDVTKQGVRKILTFSAFILLGAYFQWTKRGGEREKWGTIDKAQAFDPSRPNDFGVWSSFPLPNQLSTSNGIHSLIELSLLFSSVNGGGIFIASKRKPQETNLEECIAA